MRSLGGSRGGEGSCWASRAAGLPWWGSAWEVSKGSQTLVNQHELARN